MKIFVELKVLLMYVAEPFLVLIGMFIFRRKELCSTSSYMLLLVRFSKIRPSVNSRTLKIPL